MSKWVGIKPAPLATFYNEALQASFEFTRTCYVRISYEFNTATSTKYLWKNLILICLCVSVRYKQQAVQQVSRLQCAATKVP